MPRFLHLADLHLGRVFHGESLIEDQVHLLHQVLEYVDNNPPDTLLISGDIYDRALPPVDAVRLFDQFLFSLAEAHVIVVAIPGNHDSAGRMAYAAGAWEKLGVHIRADYRQLNKPITVKGQDGGDLEIFALPFIEPGQLGGVLAEVGSSDFTRDKEDLARSVLDSMKSARTAGRPAVLVAHEFAAGSVESGSERLYVGGSQSIPVELFGGFDYVALGHIHGAQTVGDDMIRYAGSPMAYAFDEISRKKGFFEVILDPSQLYPEVVFHELNPLRTLEVLEDSLENLLGKPEYEKYRNCYVSARVNDSLSHMNLLGRLRERFPYLRELRQTALEPVAAGAYQNVSVSETPGSVFSDFLDRAGWEIGRDRETAEKIFAEALAEPEADE